MVRIPGYLKQMMLIVDIPDMRSSRVPTASTLFLRQKLFLSSQTSDVRKKILSSSVGTHEAFLAAGFTPDRLIRQLSS